MQFKLSLTWAALMAFVVLFLSSCGPADDKVLDPSINLTGSLTGDREANMGTTLRIAGSALKGPDGKDLTSLSVTTQVPGLPANPILSITATSAQGSKIDFDTSFVVPVQAADYTLDVTVTATDKDGLKATKTIKISAKKEVIVGPTPANFLGGVVFNNTNAYIASTGTNANALTQAQANSQSGDVDLVYYWRTADPTSHSFISPGALKAAPYTGTPAEWANGTIATEYRTTSATVAEFDAAKADQSKIGAIVSAGSKSVFAGNTDGVRVGGADVAANKVIAFTGKGGKRGLILVKSLTAAGNGATVDIIVEK